MRHVAVVAISLVLLAGLAACGGGGGDDPQPQPQPQPNPQGLRFTVSNNSSVAVTRLNVGPAGGGGNTQWHDFADLAPGQSTFISLPVGNYWLVVEYNSGGNFQNDPAVNPGSGGYNFSVLTGIETPFTWP